MARCNRVEYRANGIALGTRLNSVIRRAARSRGLGIIFTWDIKFFFEFSIERGDIRGVDKILFISG